MKHFRLTKRLQKQIFVALVLTSLLFLSAGLTRIETTANSTKGSLNAAKLNKEIATQTLRNGSLPDSVAKAVLQDASKRLDLPAQQLRIVQAERRDWSDSCLGVTEPGTMCAQRVVAGWQVRVLSAAGTLVYHTNGSGSLIKLKSRDSRSPFPPDIVQ